LSPISDEAYEDASSQLAPSAGESPPSESMVETDGLAFARDNFADM
jgi:hypothetical protein